MTDLTHEISNRLNARLYKSKSPYIHVISPNSGSFEQPYTVIILWNSGYFNNFYFPNVKIELYKDGVYYSTIAESTPNNGIYSTIFKTLMGGNYQIKISVVNYSEVFGFSDYFSLVGSEINPWILTNFYYGSNVPYDNECWILTNKNYEENTFTGLDRGWILLTNGTDDPGIPE